MKFEITIEVPAVITVSIEAESEEAAQDKLSDLWVDPRWTPPNPHQYSEEYEVVEVQTE
jgi:hypothetical protein